MTTNQLTDHDFQGITLLGFPLFPLLGLVTNPNHNTYWKDKEQELPWKDFKDLIKQRLNKNKPLPTTETKPMLAVGESDYLPFSTLQAGIEKGLAVCRILLKTNSERKEDKIFDKLINLLLDENERLKNAGQEPITTNHLRKILHLAEDGENYELIQENYEQIKRIFNLKQEIPLGTGFLVGRSYLLTNYHIIDIIDLKYISYMFAEFGYEYDSLGRKSEQINYQLTKIEATNNKLDYALIKLQSKSEKLSLGKPIEKEAGNLFGFIQLNSDQNIISPPISQKILSKYQIPIDDDQEIQKQIEETLNKSNKIRDIDPQDFDWIPNILLGEPAIMIQHPQGEYKQIVLTNNRIIKINKDFLYYETDSDNGSSGSPVFNQKWELVGMNRAAVYITENQQQSTKPQESTLIGYEGIRICQITDDLILKLEPEILQEMNLQNKNGTSSPIRQYSKINQNAKINDLRNYFPLSE
ncbi:MAG: serine protease [Nostocales cyanobacterium]|nr:MAG: serine protease [Nostocales cyanobacterium]TAF18619.1 MAG: serine protease [Nostocales cyanobacterium]